MKVTFIQSDWLAVHASLGSATKQMLGVGTVHGLTCFINQFDRVFSLQHHFSQRPYFRLRFFHFPPKFGGKMTFCPPTLLPC